MCHVHYLMRQGNLQNPTKYNSAKTFSKFQDRLVTFFLSSVPHSPKISFDQMELSLIANDTPPFPQQRLDHCMIIWKYIEGFFINIPQNIMHIWNQNDAPEVSSMFLFLIERLDRQLAPVFCMKCQKGYFQDIVLLDLELTYKL